MGKLTMYQGDVLGISFPQGIVLANNLEDGKVETATYDYVVGEIEDMGGYNIYICPIQGLKDGVNLEVPISTLRLSKDKDLLVQIIRKGTQDNS